MSNEMFSYDDSNFIPSVIRKSYDLISCLKHTPEKQVYLVADISTVEKMILKCATGKSVELLETEYNFLLNQNFPFLPTVIFGQKIGENFYLIRKYYEGITLEAYVERHGLLPVNEALSIIRTIAMYIGQLHNQNPPVLHRDIKPQNFLYTSDGDYKFIDMETVKLYDASLDYDTVVIGTRKTAAPEQFGYQQSSIKTDIYGLGILLVYLLTGNYSLKDNNLASLPFTLQKIVHKCTYFDPGKRYKNIASLCKDISLYQRFRLRAVSIRLIFFIILLLSVSSSVLIYNITKEQTYTENASVEFANPNIERAARFYLNKDDTEPVSAEELSTIKALLISGDQIFSNWNNHHDFHTEKWYEAALIEEESATYSLDDLIYFTSLEDLALDMQNINDISALKGLPLKRVSLMRNNITDVSTLASVTSLEHVMLTDNPIASLEGFENLTNLHTLLIMNTDVSDLMPVKNCPLTELDRALTNVYEYDFLPFLHNLTTLKVSHIRQKEIKTFNSLTYLKQLTLMDSEITSLHELSSLKNLIFLDLTGCIWLENIEGVENFSNLEYLAIAYTNIADISLLSNVTTLHCLEPSYAPIKDFTPLLDCPFLDSMYIDSKSAKAARTQLEDRMITYHIID